jgi:hypothetical protein
VGAPLNRSVVGVATFSRQNDSLLVQLPPGPIAVAAAPTPAAVCLDSAQGRVESASEGAANAARSSRQRLPADKLAETEGEVTEAMNRLGSQENCLCIGRGRVGQKAWP